MFGAEGPFFEWWDRDAVDGGEGMWARNMELIAEAERRYGPFEAVMGFSQGGALAALLTQMAARGQGPLPHLRLGISVCGFEHFGAPDGLLASPLPSGGEQRFISLSGRRDPGAARVRRAWCRRRRIRRSQRHRPGRCPS